MKDRGKVGGLHECNLILLKICLSPPPYTCSSSVVVVATLVVDERETGTWMVVGANKDLKEE